MSLVSLWREVSKHGSAWPFRHPVDVSEVPDYLTVIKDPVDLSLIKVRLRKPLIFILSSLYIQSWNLSLG